MSKILISQSNIIGISASLLGSISTFLIFPFEAMRPDILIKFPFISFFDLLLSVNSSAIWVFNLNFSLFIDLNLLILHDLRMILITMLFNVDRFLDLVDVISFNFCFYLFVDTLLFLAFALAFLLWFAVVMLSQSCVIENAKITRDDLCLTVWSFSLFKSIDH